MFRRDVVNAWIKLASSSVTPEQQRDLWKIIDCHEWFVRALTCTYEAELEQIDRDLEAALRR